VKLKPTKRSFGWLKSFTGEKRESAKMKVHFCGVSIAASLCFLAHALSSHTEGANHSGWPGSVSPPSTLMTVPVM
jgi:hypothetical protein